MAGGTGGHVYPALAVAEALQQASQKVVWLGTRRGIEARIVPAAGIDIEWINIRGLRGKGFVAMLLAPLRMLWALLQSLRVMWRIRPAAVLGMGGFVSGPGGLAAWLSFRPLLIHEQNAVAGMTNRVLARFAKVVLQAFPSSFPEHVDARTVGNPVRETIAALGSPRERYRTRQGRLRVLVLGGSQGALILNRTVPAAIARLPKGKRPLIRHQAGPATLETARRNYELHDIDVELLAYIEDMAEAYAWADLVVCRAGALTVAELSAAGVPAIFVPFALAVDDHQTANARALERAGAAMIIAERVFNAATLADALKLWLSSRAELAEKAELAYEQAQPMALQRITKICLQAAGVTPC
jgi:UDP-N-acetylglucosamine--N-acetylmuramyl-(pentapeptide) pyrophosphoryl-undecaprenol N-acetylglucosamine transferase